MRVSLWAVVFFCSFVMLGAQIQPSEVLVEGGAGTEFDHVFTIVNTGVTPISGTLTIAPFSSYLEDTATLSDASVALRPGESKNVQVRGRVPAFGPETHELRYELVTSTGADDSFVIRMPIQGTPRLHPRIDVTANDVVRQEPLAVSAELFNFGNIIAYYNLSLKVRQGEQTHGTILYPQLVQVLPGEQDEIGLLYSDRLEPGEYSVEVSATVNEQESVQAAAPFRVLLEDQTTTIRQGEDVVLSLTGTGSAESISYTISRNNRELIRDVLTANGQEVIVPTAELTPGEYAVAVTLTHPQGTDVTRISLVVRQRNLFGTGVLITVVIGGLLSLLFTRTVRLHIKITRVAFALQREEKRLKRLIEKAHQLS